MKAFVIDIGKCCGCYNCQIACKDEHVDNDFMPYTKPQPETGHFWLKVNEYVRGTIPKVKMHYIPVLCVHCDRAPCIVSCPVDAIQKRKDGLVVIDPAKCTGCKSCIEACPYHVIYYNTKLNLAQKCTGCAHLIDSGWQMPRCADACPNDAIKFGEESELKALIKKAQVLRPDVDVQPRVYYMNIPKKFIGGTVYDPLEKEVVIGATCTLSSKDSDKVYTTRTDDYGDFWFEGLDEGLDFSLRIQKGKKSKTIENISTKKDVNLGDIPFS